MKVFIIFALLIVFSHQICFPVSKNAFASNKENWGDRRDSGKRCHAGNDLYTKGDGTIVAMTHGVVLNKYYFYSCSKGRSWALLIYHDEFKKTINYGELNEGSITVNVGQKVTPGQVLGKATYCGMLHYEVYDGKVTKNQRWLPPSGKTVGSEKNYCAKHYMSTKPKQLLNPHDIVKKATFCK